jgi:Holliday junction DNA helicase RuvB
MMSTPLLAAHDALRPASLSDFAGQPDIAQHLQIILGAAATRGQLPPHLLFSGPPGLGKTTLASLIASELDVPGRRVVMVPTSGPALAKAGDLAAILMAVSEAAVVFIDEIHALDRNVEELLYSAMEDGVLDIRVGEGDRARPIRVGIKPFTLVGATTQLGRVSKPLRDRFGYIGRLQLYNADALASIVTRSAGIVGIKLAGDAAHAIAERSCGTPRTANVLLSRVRDWSQVTAPGAPVGPDGVNTALDLFGIDAIGLDGGGRRLLQVLCAQFGGGPVGVGTLATALGEAQVTVESYEGFLMERGLLLRTAAGRKATAYAYEHLGLPVPAALLATGPDALAQPTLGPALDA